MSVNAVMDGVSLPALAERLPTPFYVYSESAIRDRIEALQHALHGLNAHIHYAVKANSNIAILRLIERAGLGADIVSVGELQRCLHAGIPAQRIVFSGVGKSADEIVSALAAGVARFNVESADELELLNRIAGQRDAVACAALRINPDVDALTHAKISTGKAENKFGIALAEARQWFLQADRLPNVRLDGLHLHIGSQLLDLEPIRQALLRAMQFVRELPEQGSQIKSIDIGGGLGVRYRPDEQPPSISDYAAVIRETLTGFDGRILLEPGRWLVAKAGLLVTRVVRVKHGEQRRFLVLDAAMNELLRPALYDAWHDIVPLVPDDAASTCYDVVGPVCETGDTFARDRSMPECQAGDLVLIDAAGAYAASMASTYNSRPLAAEVLLSDGRYAIIRRQQSFNDMIAGEQFASSWESV